MTYEEWATKHPQAAADLAALLVADSHTAPEPAAAGSEAAAQQRARILIAQQGGMAWRNNVGATAAETEHSCPQCFCWFKEKQVPVRYGLANDSQKLNQAIKSSDLILAIPRLIGPEHVGRTIAQFGAVECKRPGWKYVGTGREVAQGKWLALIEGMGGFARFSTGDININEEW